MRVLDAKCEKANINAVINDMHHLSSTERQQLKVLLHKFEHLFDGALGHWKTDSVNFELKGDAKPYHAKPHPTPHMHEKTSRKEIDRLVKIGVLKKPSNGEWASPTFITPKKSGAARAASDFRKLHSMLRRKPHPIPKTQDVLQKLGGFTHAISIDLNMGCCAMHLSPEVSKLCAVRCAPAGKASAQVFANGGSWKP